jgi:hypothetical protein
MEKYNDYSIDVWCDESYNAVAECLGSPKEGMAIMRKLKKEGKTSIRMYVRHDTKESDNWYYSFDGNKIIKETNNLNA